MSAAATVEILSPGAYASIQDFGRRGYRRFGVPWAGVLDQRLARIANALVGNAANSAVIECFDGGLQLTARGAALRLAVAGDATLERAAADGAGGVVPWRSFVLAEGETLRVRRLGEGRIAVVAVAGLAVAQVLGSASTYARAALGGVDGRVLEAGMRLSAAAAGDGPERVLPHPPVAASGPIRVVAGPQAEHFSGATLETFFGSEYRVTVDADRMGIRLDGPRLQHLGPAEIVSDATVSGSIQVPGSGLPIVLLADAQTAGGYPKIATVISADLARLAACRPGQTLRFAAIDALEGEAAARAAEAETVALLAAIRPLPQEGADLAALYSANLVSGVIDACAAEYRPLGAENSSPRRPS